MSIQVRQATVQDLETLVPLFDAYRQFYRQPADLEGARRFLLARFENNQSTIFVALADTTPAGFTQLYPSFSSASMARIFILNDLFVAPAFRRMGAASALLAAAVDYSRRVGAVRMALSTELSNQTAQSLYERAGWERDTTFCNYRLAL